MRSLKTSMANDEALAQAKVTEKVISINLFFLFYFLCLANLSPIDKWPNRSSCAMAW